MEDYNIKILTALMKIECRKRLYLTKKQEDCFALPLPKTSMSSFCQIRVLVNALFTLTESVGSTPRSILLTLSITGSKQKKSNIAGESEHMGISGISTEDASVFRNLQLPTIDSWERQQKG